MRTSLNLHPFGEAFHHGEVSLSQNRVRLNFQVGEGVFSAASVDVGTRLLLKTLATSGHAGGSRVLDLGCGYGPLGLALAAMSPRSVVDLVDRDAVALAYARLNSELNGVGGVRVEPGLGWADVPADRRYDLFVSNIPAKIGTAALESWLIDGAPHMDDDGVFAIVVISRLEQEVDAVLQRAGAEIVLRQTNRGHVAIHYRLVRPAGDRRTPGLHLSERTRPQLSAGKLRWTATTAWGLPEFDSLHHATRLGVRSLKDIHRRRQMTAAVVGTGVGHGALAIRQALKPDQFHLVDRDLLALRFSAENLRSAGQDGATIAVHHAPLPKSIRGSVDLCLAVFTTPAAQSVVDAVVASCAAALRPAGRLVVAGTSTAVTRALERVTRGGLPLIAVSRSREKAHSAADLVRRPD